MPAPTVGYVGTLAKSGTPTTLTNEACSAIADDATGRHRHQVTAASKRVLDPNTAIVVKENGVASNPANIFKVDAPSGIVVWATAYTPTAPITISGKYVPRSAVSYVKNVKSAPKVKPVDVTDLNAAGYEKAIPGLLSWSGSFDVFDIASGQGFDVLLTGRTPVLFDYDPLATGAFVMRGWVTLSQETQDTEPGAANVTGISFTLFDYSAIATALSGFRVDAGVSVWTT